jgi:type II secretory pathway pseudopilin PulG
VTVQHRARGFTYLAVMFIVGVLGLTASMANALWSTLAQRDNERELAFAGRQFQHAIERYRQRSATAEPRYPRRLEDLLRDDRSPLQPVRHLRRIYLDPMTGLPEWGLIRAPDGGIVGVHSMSERRPMAGTLLAASFQRDEMGGGDAASYREWRFMVPSASPSAGASAPASPARGPGERSDRRLAPAAAR